MATGRKISFSTNVIPKKIFTMDESSITHTDFQDNGNVNYPDINKVLGGKGEIVIAPAQWGDGWSSDIHTNIENWEDFTLINWEDVLLHPNGEGSLNVTSAASPATQLSTDVNHCIFLHISNIGAQTLYLSLNNTGGNYHFEIPANASINLRPVSSVGCNEIFVKTASSSTNIQYLMAKSS